MSWLAYFHQLLALKWNETDVLFFRQIERIARAEPGPFGSVSETELQNLDISRPGTSSTQAATAPNGVSQAAMSSQSVSAAYKVLPKTLRGTALHIFVADGWLKGSPTRNNHYCLGVSPISGLGVKIGKIHLHACRIHHCLQ